MQTPRRTRSSVLGKRSHQASADESFTSVSTDKPDDEGVLPTPESTPKLKRARTMVLEDGAGNKENIPPFRTQSLVELSPSSGRAIRSIRRTNSYSPRMPSSALTLSRRRYPLLTKLQQPLGSAVSPLCRPPHLPPHFPGFPLPHHPSHPRPSSHSPLVYEHCFAPPATARRKSQGVLMSVNSSLSSSHHLSPVRRPLVSHQPCTSPDSLGLARPRWSTMYSVAWPPRTRES